MPQTGLDTFQLLYQHHRGPSFCERMVATAPGRFNEAFWQFWQMHIEPCLPPAPRLLDLGTGPGFALGQWAQRYPGGHFIGVDVMPYMLERAAADLKGIPGIQLLQADLHDPHLPLEANSIDAAQAVVVLHEMVQPLRLLQEVLRLLKPGGGDFCWWIGCAPRSASTSMPIQRPNSSSRTRLWKRCWISLPTSTSTIASAPKTWCGCWRGWVSQWWLSSSTTKIALCDLQPKSLSPKCPTAHNEMFWTTECRIDQ